MSTQARQLLSDFQGVNMNVMMFAAGATIGDGVTDATAVIQRGLKAISAYGGGKLFFPAGTYCIQPTVAQKAFMAFSVTFDGSSLTATSPGGSPVITISGYTVQLSDIGHTLTITGGSGYTLGTGGTPIAYGIVGVNVGANTWTLSANVSTGAASGLTGTVANDGIGILQAYDNTHICGAGMGISIIKIADYAGIYTSVFGPIGRIRHSGSDANSPYQDYHGFLMSDITIDQNSLMNYPPYISSRNYINRRGVVYSSQGSTNMHFERVHVDNVMSVNALYVAAPYATVRGCKFTNIGGSISGTCNVSGTTVTWVSGPLFSTFAAGSPFKLAGIVAQSAGTPNTPRVNFAIASVTDSTHLVLVDPEGVLTGQTYTGKAWTSSLGFDHSTLYMTRNHQVMSDNQFQGRGFDAPGATCAIETHGGNQTITGNSIDYMYLGMNITGWTTEGDSVGITITGNVINNSYYGITLWSYKYPLAGGGGHITGYGIRDLICSGNSIRLTQTQWVYGSFSNEVSAFVGNPWGIIAEFHSTLPFKSTKISDNDIEFDLETYYIHLDGSTITGSASVPYIVTITGYTLDGSEVGKTLRVTGGTGFNTGVYPIMFVDLVTNKIYLGGTAKVTNSSGSGLIADIAFPHSDAGGGITFWDSGGPVKVFTSGTATIDSAGTHVTVTTFTPDPVADIGATMGFVSGTNVTPGSAHQITAVSGQTYTVTPSTGTGGSSDAFGFISLPPSFDFYEQLTITNNTITNCPMTGVRVMAAGTDLLIADNHIVNPGSTRLRSSAPAYRSGIFVATSADLVVTTRDQVNTRVLRNTITDNLAVTLMDQAITWNIIGKVNAICKDNIITVNGDAVNLSQPHVIYTAGNAPFIDDIVDAKYARVVLPPPQQVTKGSRIVDLTKHKRWESLPTRTTWTSISYRRNNPYMRVTGATNASPIVITADASYDTGTQVEIGGVTGNTAANGVWTVTNVSSTTFSLNGSTGNGACTNTLATTGWCTDTQATVTNATNASPIVVTVSQSFPTGTRVQFGGLVGNTALNGQWWIVTQIDATHMSVNGSTGNGAYVSGGTCTTEDYQFPDIIYCDQVINTPNCGSANPIIGWVNRSQVAGTSGSWFPITALDATQNLQWNNSLVLHGGIIVMDNAEYVGWKDNTGTLGAGIWVNSANNTQIFNRTGGQIQFIKSVTGTVAFIDDTGLNFPALTASKPLLTDGSKYAVSGTIDLGNAAHVAGTGLTSGSLTKWNGSNLVNATGADIPAVTLSGDVTGNTGATVVSLVGGSTAANVHAAELLANAATAANTASAIAKRDAGGSINFDTVVNVTAAKVGTGSNGVVNMLVGSATNAGYIEFRMTPGGTRRGYIGNDTSNLTINLENGSLPKIAGSGYDGTIGTINATLSLTGQTATLGAQNLRIAGAAVPAGLYRVAVYVNVSTAGTGGTCQATVNWNDGSAARNYNIFSVTLNSVNNYGQGDTVCKADGVNDINITTTVSGATGSPQYSIYAALQRLF